MKDLTKILKVGDIVWSNMIGKCKIISINNPSYNIIIKNSSNNKFLSITKFGEYLADIGICTIFPSKEKQNWDDYIPDKALVECWDDDMTLGKNIRFYDAINKKAFSIFNGKRDEANYDNYKVIPDTKWAIEARKQLKD